MCRADLTRSVAAGLAAFAALLLAACGGGGEYAATDPADAPSPGGDSGPLSSPPESGSPSETPQPPGNVTSTVPDPWSG